MATQQSSTEEHYPSRGGLKPVIVSYAPNPDAFIGRHPAQQMLDGVDTIIRFAFSVPLDFTALVSAQVILVAGGTGDLRRAVNTDFGRACAAEAYNTHSGAIAAGQVAVLINNITCLDISAALAGLAAGDWVGVEFSREASNVLDTVNASVWFLGFRLRYA